MTASNHVANALDAFLDPRGDATIRFGLDRIRSALKALGDPQDRIPPAIHIAGTNGKGSTAAFCRAIADAADLTAHVFSSPHLIRVNERIRISGRLVEDDALADALEDIAKAGPDLTYFEALTAAAYLLFSRTPADLSIIETGAGGLLDSTNVMRAPAATAITAVSRDHEALFGTSDIAEIARTKAGIFRAGIPAFIAAQDETPFDALIKAAGGAGAILKAHGMGWRVETDEDAFVFETPEIEVRTEDLALSGPHQFSNAGLACATMLHLFPSLSQKSMAQGLGNARWPGRLQTLKPGPLVRASGAETIVDGAHNPAAAEALAKALGPERKDTTALIIALQGNKDLAKMAGPLSRVANDVFACPLPSAGQEGGGGADPDVIAGGFIRHGAHAMPALDVWDAAHLARAGGAARVVVCGSLYLAGAALDANGETLD